MNGDPPKKKRLGPGMSGTHARMSRSEEKVMAAGLEGKTDVSTGKKYIAALNAQHKKSGEPKSSSIGRSKRSPRVSSSDRRGISVLDTSTGKRVKGKKKSTPEQKARAKRAAANATSGKSRAEKRLYRQR